MIVTIECTVTTPCGLGLRQMVDGKTMIQHLVVGGNAEAAGVMAGDIILQADGRGEEEYETLLNYLKTCEEDTEIVLVLDREMAAPPSIEEVEDDDIPEESTLALHEKTVEVERLRIANALAMSELATLRQQKERPLSDAEFYRRKLVEMEKERNEALQKLKEHEEESQKQIAEKDEELKEYKKDEDEEKEEKQLAKSPEKGPKEPNSRDKAVSENHPELWREWCGKEQRGMNSQGHVFASQHRYDIVNNGWKY